LFFLFFFDGLFDGLDEVGAFLVVGELGGEVVGIFAPRIIKRSYSLIRIVEDAPNDFHPRNFWGPSAGFLGRFWRLGSFHLAFLGRFFVIFIFTLIRGRVFGVRLLLALLCIFILFFVFIFLFFFRLVGFFIVFFAALGGVEVRAHLFAV